MTTFLKKISTQKIACTYCQKLCRMVALDTYQCDYHGAVMVQFFPNPFPMTNPAITNAMAFIYKYKNHNYRLTFYYGDFTDHPKFVIHQVLFNNKTGDQKILELDFHPNITPENVADKLPTLLTFS